jgi:hypothetical protein
MLLMHHGIYLAGDPIILYEILNGSHKTIVDDHGYGYCYIGPAGTDFCLEFVEVL